MIIDIKPIGLQNYDCVEEVLYSVARWAIDSYRLMFAQTWGFEFIENDYNDKTIGNKFGPGYSHYDTLSNLNNYCGVKALFKKFNNKRDILKYIQKKLENGYPIAIENKDKHYLLVIGYEENIGIYFFDTLISTAIQFKKNDEFLNTILDDYIDFNFEDKKKFIDNWHYILNPVLQKVNGRCKFPHMIEAMKKFLHYLKNEFSIVEEKKNLKSIESSVLIIKLRYISGGRQKFSEILNYLGKINNIIELELLSKEFLNCSEKWDIICGLFIKIFLVSDYCPILKKIIKKVEEVIDIEENNIINLNKLYGENQDNLTNTNIIKKYKIDNYLLNVKEVKEVVIMERNDNGNNKYLCAYYTATKEISKDYFISILRKDLPSYLIPSFFVNLKQMPLINKGTINLKELPEPKTKLKCCVENIVLTNEEAKLIKIYQNVLGIVKVGINDNFFEIGGNSLKANFLISEIHKIWNIKLPLDEIFINPTIKKIADKIVTINLLINQEIIGRNKEEEIEI